MTLSKRIVGLDSITPIFYNTNHKNYNSFDTTNAFLQNICLFVWREKYSINFHHTFNTIPLKQSE